MNLIFQNAAATYARSLVALLLGLFSSRWVLQALGTTDFGLYAVVGSVVSLIVFVGGLLNISVARNYAFAIGAKGQSGKLSEWFSAAFLIYAVLAASVVLIGWPIGEWVVRHVLVIPAGRMQTCVAVFRLSLFVAAVNLLSVPYGAMYTAQQKFVKLAIFGLCQTCIIFLGALWLRNAEGDRLWAYACYMAGAFMGPALAQVGGAMVEFSACRAPFSGANWAKVRAILSFAGWTLVGGGGLMFAYHGGAFVTNRFFGAAANAAYGIAQQVQFHTEALANSLLGAFEPAVTTSEGAGNGEQTLRLAYQGGKLGAVLILFFVVPLSLELPTVLEIWLGDFPQWSVEVCRILLAAAAINKMMMGQHLVFNAKGKIAHWQVCCGIVLAGTVPVAVVFALGNWGIVSAAWAFFLGIVGCSVIGATFAHRMAGMSIGGWGREVVAPVGTMAVLALLMGSIPQLFMPPGFFRVCLTSLLSMGVFSAWGLWKWRGLLSQKI